MESSLEVPSKVQAGTSNSGSCPRPPSIKESPVAAKTAPGLQRKGRVTRPPRPSVQEP